MSEGFAAVDRDGSSKRAEERVLRERVEKSEEQLDIYWLMSEPAGRRVAMRMLNNAGCFRPSYTQGDSHHTAFREGERNQGNWLLTQVLKETPEQYALMLKENSDANS